MSAVAVPAAACRCASGSTMLRQSSLQGSRLVIPGAQVRRSQASRRCVVRAALPGADPSAIDHLAAHITPMLYTIADTPAAAVVEEAARSSKEGPLTPLANAFEGFLKVLDNGLEAAHVPYSYGFAIILLTVLVKAATFPLSKKQVESTMAMQTLQPRIKELQERYKNDQERLQTETARLYQEAGVNPLAGCLPTVATIPVFIGLYRALSNAADDGLLTEGFFWIPSLGGPTSLAARNAGSGSNWLFPFTDGHPPIGWHDAGAYLVLPVLLVISQFASQKIMSGDQPKSEDPAQQQTQAILKFLPLMIGWFSLNVPSGLTLYWITNNILTTAQSLFLKRNPAAAVTAMAESIPMGATTIVKEEPKAEKKKMSGKEMGSRKKKGDKFKQLKEMEAQGKGGKGATFAALKAAELAAKEGGSKEAEEVEAEIVTKSNESN